MPGVRDILGIVVSSRLGKGNVSSGSAVSLFMDVETQKAGGGQPDQSHNDQGASAIGGKLCLPHQLRMRGVPSQKGAGDRGWDGSGEYGLFHIKTSFFYPYAPVPRKVMVDEGKNA